MKNHRTTDHLAKGAAALLALLISFGSFAAAASAFEPEPFEPPTPQGLDELVGPDICELIDCGVIVPGDDGDDEPGDDEPGDDEPGDDEPGDDEPGDDEPGDDDGGDEPEDEEDDETNIDTPVEATPTFTG